MTDDELRAFIERQEARATRPEVAREQALAMDYYLRRPFGNEEEGRSQVISSDVWDVVEGMLPALLKPFVSSPDVVQFNARGAEDEEAAKQETDYLNYVVTQRNDAFIQFNAWAKAGLLQKNGVVKWWWDTTHAVTIEIIRGIDENILAVLEEEEGVEVVAATEITPKQTDYDTEQGQPVVRTFDVRIKRTEKRGHAHYETIPPEELLVIGRDPNIQNSIFVQHRQRKTISDLREMGYDIADDIQDAGSGDVSMNEQAVARNRDFDQSFPGTGEGDPSMREVWYRETLCYVDKDGDGIAELRKVCLVGTTILADDEADEINFASWTPYQQLWQFDGRCPADEATEVQEVKSTLVREALNNLYTINNNRVYAGNKVNLDDLIDNQIGGIVRVDSDIVGNQVVPAAPVPIGQYIMPMIEYEDSVKENRTGYTRYNQGASDLNNQKTLGEVRIVSQAGMGRIELIQRAFAEQGVKTLMLGLHGLVRRHDTKAETVRLRGKWVNIDPSEWKKRYDMTVSVGLGTMDKSIELQGQTQLTTMQAQALEAGIPVVTPENVYNGLAKFAELLGEKNPDKYFTHPDKVPAKEPPSPMSDPKFMIGVAEFNHTKQKDVYESNQKDRELGQKDRELDQKDAQLGIDQLNARIDALERHHRATLDTEKHQREMALPHPQELAAGNQALAADQQEHSQGMAVRQQDEAERSAQVGEEQAAEEPAA